MTRVKRRRTDIESGISHDNPDFMSLVGETVLLTKKRTDNTLMVGTTLIMSIFYYVIANLIDKLLLTNDMSKRALSRDPRMYGRRSWISESRRFSNRMFCRLFRMDKTCFDELVTQIKDTIGDDKFQSEQYLTRLEKEGASTIRGRMYQARVMTVGRPICGEWKLAITLRMMSGGQALDMYLWSNISIPWVFSIFNTVTAEWINVSITIDVFEQVMENNTRLNDITLEFAKSTNGIIGGCMGALDGWLVTMRAPSYREVPNPGKYFSRKGFYAFNVQVIVDRNRLVLWRSIRSIGSCHDSRAFNGTKLAAFLKRHAQTFVDKKLYFIGDSAYALRPYMLTPFDNALPDTKEDTFNFFLSSNRINVECAFGEISRRWGIFWRPLEGSLTRKTMVIDAGLKLHNFLVNYRIRTNASFDNHDKEELDIARDNFSRDTSTVARGMHVHDTLLQTRDMGRPTNDEKSLRSWGQLQRMEIANELWNMGYRRK